MPRNLRNRNPGNITFDQRNKWVGQAGCDGPQSVKSNPKQQKKPSVRKAFAVRTRLELPHGISHCFLVIINALHSINQIPIIQLKGRSALRSVYCSLKD